MKQFLKINIIAIALVGFGHLLSGQTDTTLSSESVLVSQPDSVKINMLKDLALSYKFVSLKKGLEYADQRIMIARRLNDARLIGDTYNTYGILYYSAGLYSSAIENYTSCFNTYDSIGYIDGMATASHNLGLTYFEMEDTLQCLLHYKKSVEYRIETGVDSRIGDGLTTLGEAYLCFNDQEKSLKSLYEALEYYGEIKKYKRKIDCISMICDNLLKISNPRALEWIRVLEEENRDYSSEVIDHLINFKYSKFYLQSGNLPEAESYLSRVNADTVLTYELIDPVSHYANLADSLRDRGMNKKALEYAAIARKLHYRNNMLKTKKLITDFKTRLDLRSAEEELERRQQINLLILQQIKIDRNIKYFLMILFSSLGIILLNILYGTIVIRKSSIMLERRKSELEEAYERSVKYENSILSIRESKNLFFKVITDKLSVPLIRICKEIEESNGMIGGGIVREDYLRMLADINSLAISIERRLKRILLWSKLERNKYEVRKTHIHLNDYLHELLPEILGMSIKKDIRIRYDINDTILVNFDRRSLDSILRILIENSIDNSVPKTEIIIRGQRARSGTIISVTDFGKGISDVHQGNIFDFNHSTMSDWNEDKLGLGLIIARHLAEINNSYISFESNPKKGTTFFVHIKE